MVLAADPQTSELLESLRAASEQLRARSEEAAAARARVEMLLAGQDKARAAATGPLAVFVLDRGGRIEGAAGAALSRLGVDPTELTGRSILDVYADHPDLAGSVRTALSGEESALRVEVAERVMETRSAPVRDREGRPAGALSVWVDVTDRERAAADLAAVERDLRETLGSVSGNGAATSEHEAIEAAAQTGMRAMRAFFDGEIQGMAERLRGAAERERALAAEVATVRGQLDVSRQEGTRLDAERERIDAERVAAMGQLLAAMDEVGAARADTESARSQAREAEARAEEARREAAGLRLEATGTAGRLRAALADAEALRAEAREARAEIERRAADEALRLDELQRLARDRERAASEREGALAAECERLRRQIEAARQDTEAVRAARERADADLQATEARLRAAAEDTRVARDEVARLEASAFAEAEERERLAGATDERERAHAVEAAGLRGEIVLLRDEAARRGEMLRAAEDRERAQSDEAGTLRADLERSREESARALLDALDAKERATAALATAAEARRQSDEAHAEAIRREEALRAGAELEERLRAEIAELTNAIAAERDRLAERDAASAERAARLEAQAAEIAALSGGVDQERSRADAAEGDAAAARFEAMEAGARLRAAVDESTSMRRDIARLEAALAAETSRREQAEHEATLRARDHAAEVDDLRASGGRAQERVAALSEDLGRVEQRASAAERRAEDAEARAASSAMSATELTARAEAAEAAAEEARSAHGSAVRELEAERAERERAAADVRAVTQRLNAAIDDAARARTRAQDTEEQLKAATLDAAAARAQAESRGREADDARQRADEAERALDALRAAHAELGAAAERLRSAGGELVAMRERAERAEAQIARADAAASEAQASRDALAKQVEHAVSAIDAATSEAAAARARAASAERRLETVSAIRPGAGNAADAARYDSLTDLPDRRALLALLADAMQRSRATGSAVSLLLMDIDSFKDINDAFGHTVGDTIIRQMAERIANSIRGGDVVARLGGDEFAVVLPATATDEAAEIAREVLVVSERPFAAQDQEFDVQASIGLATDSGEGATAEELLRRAEVAMYRAKRSHGGCVAYTADDDDRSPERLMLLGELRRAIGREELRLFWQPQVRFTTGQVVGMEALVRWDHPRRGLLPPGAFVPLAERTGVIKPLHEWVLRSALRQCAEWSAYWDEPMVSVNASMPNVLDPRYVDTIQRALGDARVAPTSLSIEITESVIMGDPERAKHVVSDLRALGVRVSIDDFGTGYSSLGYLQQLDVNEIKIDKTFVFGLADDRARAAIVRTSIDLGHHFGLEVVAEGVEDQRAWDILNTTACDTAQGFHISPPLPAGELVRSLADRGWIGRGAERGLRVA